jgi:Fic family protein
LHFWIGYLHPFCDWNWRTARAIFYRYLNKKWYKDFTYIPISRAIKNSRKQYWDAYVYSSQEWYDLTFFLVYIAQKTQQAFKEYKEFILKQKEENGSLQVKISSLYGVLLNERQLSVITYFIENPKKYTNNSVYQNQYKVSQNTAKTDLLWLKEIWLLQTKNEWNFINYYPTQALLDLSK